MHGLRLQPKLIFDHSVTLITQFTFLHYSGVCVNNAVLKAGSRVSIHYETPTYTDSMAGFFLEMSFRGEIAFVGRENVKNIQLAA